MKKQLRFLVAASLALVLILGLSACGESNAGYKAFETVKLLQSGSYYYEGKYFDGSDLDGYTIKLASRGSDFAIVFYDPNGNEIARSLGLDGKGYYLDTQNKTFAKDVYYDNVTYAYSGLAFVESGTGIVPLLAGIEDAELFYEEYEYDIDSDKGTIRFLFKDSVVIGFQEDFVDAEGTVVSEVILLEKISKEAPDELFLIPEDFTETE